MPVLDWLGQRDVASNFRVATLLQLKCYRRKSSLQLKIQKHYALRIAHS